LDARLRPARARSGRPTTRRGAQVRRDSDQGRARIRRSVTLAKQPLSRLTSWRKRARKPARMSTDKTPPPLPKRPEPPPRPRASFVAVAVACMFALALFVGLVLLAGVLGPIVLAAGGLLLLILLVTGAHYLIWGY